ncbi:MAG: hypothetical protein Q7T63_07035 [Burkholderiaceae bacterium]|uniref:hypothetical protein n=1 Tax=Hydrogenophaga sp. TaxID=1904254 RepID=UPI0027264061|nr:hypothetical protein [Hydrogenophaga sp.]MDO8277863.1 hypothetical protein [Burkholderiaceae bacterium]MDO9030939.1 hypothetical protein [Hydrogenophaga sp.]
MSSDKKTEASPPEPPKKSEGGWAVGLLGSEVCFFLFLACLMKPTSHLSARDRREVWLFRGCWFGTVALAALSTAVFSRSAYSLVVTKSIVAAGSAFLVGVVACLHSDGYLWKQFVGVGGPNWVWRPATGGVMFLALGVVLLRIIGDKHSNHSLVFSIVAVMACFMSVGFLFRIAFRNFQRK